MATLKDIAREVGISTAAVSLVLAGKGRISAEVRARVFAAARELGYRSGKVSIPDEHPAAVMLLPVHETQGYVWHFLKDTIESIQQEMIRRGITSVLLPMTREQTAKEILELIQKINASAVFSIHYGNEILFNALSTRGIPLVVVNNSDFQRHFTSVCVDDFQGAYEAARFLIERGHVSLGFVDYPRPDLPVTFSDRFIGFRKAIEEQGLTFSDERRITVPLDDPNQLTVRLRELFAVDTETAYSTGVSSLPAVEPPTALFVHDDFQAVSVHFILANLGLRVPEDVSLIAPGDTMDYTQPETPRITTMRINTTLMGRYAADLMQELSLGTEGIHVLKIKQQLTDRGSVGQP